MTPEQLAQFRSLIASGKSPRVKSTDPELDPNAPVFLRGWNAGLEFAEAQLAKVLGEAPAQEGAG